jgi:hypothetical protein
VAFGFPHQPGPGKRHQRLPLPGAVRAFRERTRRDGQEDGPPAPGGLERSL